MLTTVTNAPVTSLGGPGQYTARVTTKHIRRPEAVPSQLHPLSEMHFRQLAHRRYADYEGLQSIWGVTWNTIPGTFRRLGQAAMMVMSYHQNFAGTGHTIELRCVNSRMLPDGVIDYGDIRLSHDFRLQPEPGANGRRLDPRPDNIAHADHERPNGSWVALGLGLDGFIAHHARKPTYQLRPTPMLPDVYVGFSEIQNVPGSFTLPLQAWVARLNRMSLQKFQELTPETQTEMVVKVWPDLWISPTDARNRSGGHYLIHADMISSAMLISSQHLFEDLSPLCGVSMTNPAATPTMLRFPNYVRRVVEANNLTAEFAKLHVMEAVTAELASDGIVSAESQTQTDELNAAYTKLAEVVPQCFLPDYRQFLTDELIMSILEQPDDPIFIENVDIQKMPISDGIRRCRQILMEYRPSAAAVVTDEELRTAIENPQEQLHVAGLARSELMFRRPDVSPEEAFTFNSTALGRFRTSAHLWAGSEWKPPLVIRK